MVGRAIPIPAGALFTVTTGSYSDYTVHGVFRAKVEIDADALLAKWFQDHPEQNNPYRFRDREFIASISNMIEPVDCWEFYVTDCGSPGEHQVSKMDNDL